MASKIYTHEYEILPVYMKYILGNELRNLQEIYPTAGIRKLSGSSNRSGLYIVASSLLMLEDIKVSIYEMVLSAEVQHNNIKILKNTIKERIMRQHQYEAAEIIRRNFEAEAMCKTSESLEKEVIITKNNLSEKIQNTKHLNNNRFSILAYDEDSLSLE
jgi:hypothetical protein